MQKKEIAQKMNKGVSNFRNNLTGLRNSLDTFAKKHSGENYEKNVPAEHMKKLHATEQEKIEKRIKAREGFK